MLNKLTIRNYQSLQDLEINLGRFTVIFGESDTGKSAVIRALRSAINNQPGQDFITHGADTAVVKMELESSTIEWTKNKSAKYRLEDSNGIETFEKMGRSVPNEISEVLKIGRTAFMDSQEFDANIHSQMEPPFLLTESPATRAKLLGELSGVNVLYRAIQECRRRVQSTKRLQTTRLSDLEKTKNDLDGYRYLTDIAKALSFAEQRMDSAEKFSSDSISISSDIDQLDNLQIQIQQSQKAVDAASSIQSRIDSVKSLANQASEIDERTREISYMQAQIANEGERIKAMESHIEELRSEVSNIEICPTCGQLIDHQVYSVV